MIAPDLDPHEHRRSRCLGDVLRGVMSAFLAPAMVVSFPLVNLVVRQRRRLERQQAAGALIAPVASAASGAVLARRTSGSSGVADVPVSVTAQRVPLFETVRVDPEFSAEHYALTFAALQRGTSPKLLDLVPARMLCAEVFAELAGAWSASRDTVPRLGILVSFERWVMLRETALAALQPLIARGIRIEVFYAEQASGGHLGEWFTCGRVVHDVAAVIATLAERGQPGPSWQIVLDTLSRLARFHTSAVERPALLIDIAELALSCGGAEQAAMLAREALYDLPEKARAMQSKALCELSAALMDLGETAAGVSVLDEAIAMAAAITDPAIGASALCESGRNALHHGDYPGAERRFRGAVALLSRADRRPHLRALVHHRLAIALMHQGKEDAEHHAWIALALRPDPQGSPAEADRNLLSKLRKLRFEIREADLEPIALPPASQPHAPEVNAEGSLGSPGPRPPPTRDDPMSRASAGGRTVATDDRSTTECAP